MLRFGGTKRQAWSLGRGAVLDAVAQVNKEFVNATKEVMAGQPDEEVKEVTTAGTGPSPREAAECSRVCQRLRCTRSTATRAACDGALSLPTSGWDCLFCS